MNRSSYYMLLMDLKKRQKPKLNDFPEEGISIVLSFDIEEFKYQQEQMRKQTLKKYSWFC